MSTITRALRCQVLFDGWRQSDLKGEHGLYRQLDRAREDLTIAANKLMAALFAAECGQYSKPLYPEGHKKAGEQVHTQTLSYRGISGLWQPMGEPLYIPRGRRVSGDVLLATSGAVYTRLQKDWKEALRGKKSLPSFRLLPLSITAKGVEIHPETGAVILRLWEGRKDNRVRVRAVNPDPSTRAILDKIRRGVYRHGDAKLFFHDRKRKWMLSLSWTGEVEEVPQGLVAGLDLRMGGTKAYLSYLSPDGKALYERDTLAIPGNVWRAYRRIEVEQRERLNANRQIHEEREGRGRERKLRVVESISDKRGRITESAIEELAGAIVRTLQKRKVRILVLEDLVGLTHRQMQDSEDTTPVSHRALRRQRFLLWHQAGLREAVASAAQKAGIEVRKRAPHYTSRECSKCGLVWTDHRAPIVEERLGRTVVTSIPNDGFGNVLDPTFRCSCGAKMHRGWNASLNIARRGLREDPTPSSRKAQKA